MATIFVWGEVNDIKHSLMDKLEQRMDDKSFSHKYDSYLKAHLGKAEQTAMSFSVVSALALRHLSSHHFCKQKYFSLIQTFHK